MYYIYIGRRSIDIATSGTFYYINNIYKHEKVLKYFFLLNFMFFHFVVAVFVVCELCFVFNSASHSAYKCIFIYIPTHSGNVMLNVFALKTKGFHVVFRYVICWLYLYCIPTYFQVVAMLYKYRLFANVLYKYLIYRILYGMYLVWENNIILVRYILYRYMLERNEICHSNLTLHMYIL